MIIIDASAYGRVNHAIGFNVDMTYNLWMYNTYMG